MVPSSERQCGYQKIKENRLMSYSYMYKGGKVVDKRVS